MLLQRATVNLFRRSIMSIPNRPPKRALSASPPPSALPASTIDLAPAAKRAKVETVDQSLAAVPAAAAAVETGVVPSKVVPGVKAGTNEAATAVSRGKKDQANKNRRNGKRTVGKVKAVKPGGAEEAGAFDVVALLSQERVNELEASDRDWKKESEVEWGFGAGGKDIEVDIVALNSHGDGLGLLQLPGEDKPCRLISVPFALPGERVLTHVARHEPDFHMSHGDLVSIIKASEKRQASVEDLTQWPTPSAELKTVQEKYGARVQCKYFGQCSGCQYQPLSYDEQLKIKQDVVRKAFANFSQLDESLIPAIGPTLPSPLQYGYRTKLTPHFQAPPTGGKRKQWKGKGKGVEAPSEINGEGREQEKEWEVTIGFEQKGRKRIIDIEECPIATKVINEQMTIEREKVKSNISSFKRGATILLRDSLPPRPEGAVKSSTPSTEPHICITDHHQTVREQVGSVEFEQIAGSFFQNNNSILPSLLTYIADAVRAPKRVQADPPTKSYLVDAYCGSGLFAISLADQFDFIEGVEIDKNSVKWAKKNAEFNKGDGRGQVGFRDGKAEAIFDTIEFPSDQTTILIDPPRKGCDDLFLSQLLRFNPATVVYVSCNVHTQARDIGWIVRESAKRAEAEGKGKKGFWIESVRAADLFANTHHAEGVAILRREL